MGDEPDPEVVADLQLRAQTVRERGRTAREVTWQPPKIVDKWPCRCCKKPVDVTEEAMDRYVQFSAMLQSRGEPRLDHTAILYCDACKAEFLRTAPARRRGQVERMRPVIQQVKNSKNPEGEHAAIRQLEVWGHPDVPGLVQCVRNRLDAEKSKGKRKGEL